MAVLAETPYRFDTRKIANWTANQEKSISTEYPFSVQAEPLEQYVARTYLQFLWLPEVSRLLDLCTILSLLTTNLVDNAIAFACTIIATDQGAFNLFGRDCPSNARVFGATAAHYASGIQ